MNTILSLLVTRSKEAGGLRVSDNDLTRWIEASGTTLTQFLDKIGGDLAKAYSDGELTYKFCDTIVNDLFALLVARAVTDSQEAWPMLFDEVYDAFDAGEYYHRADRSDDPVVEFTNPAIAAIVAKLQ
jgi:hypothetical protein